jgi:Right handed beta helix region
MRRVIVVAVAGVSTVVAAMLPMSSASAATVKCGDTFTRNVVLTRNLTCVGDGLIVGAPGVTVNLGGYTLRGDGTGTGISDPANLGVAVRNGRIATFQYGVVSSAGTVTADQVTFISAGMRVFGAVVVQITSSVFRGAGISALNPHPLTISDSDFRDGADVAVHDGFAVVERSNFSNASFGAGQVGRVTLRASKFASSSFSASQSNVDLLDNDFSNSGVNLYYVWYGESSVVGNRFVGGDVGLSLGDPFLGNVTVSDNTFRDNGSAGMTVSSSLPTPGSSVQVTNNKFVNNGYAPTGSSNSGLWITTTGVAVTVTGNLAKNNAGYGIEAHGATDGGGNVAKLNGNPGQCLGVICRS